MGKLWDHCVGLRMSILFLQIYILLCMNVFVWLYVSHVSHIYIKAQVKHACYISLSMSEKCLFVARNYFLRLLGIRTWNFVCCKLILLRNFNCFFMLLILATTPWFESYRETFLQSMPASDHEFLNHYLACILWP